jgi:hypothetical protein
LILLLPNKILRVYHCCGLPSVINQKLKRAWLSAINNAQKVVIVDEVLVTEVVDKDAMNTS